MSKKGNKINSNRKTIGEMGTYKQNENEKPGTPK
jgi:hypothetical protein